MTYTNHCDVICTTELNVAVSSAEFWVKLQVWNMLNVIIVLPYLGYRGEICLTAILNMPVLEQESIHNR